MLSVAGPDSYEQTAILGMLMATTQRGLQQQPDAATNGRMRDAARGCLEALFKTDAERLRLGPTGVILLGYGAALKRGPPEGATWPFGPVGVSFGAFKRGLALTLRVADPPARPRTARRGFHGSAACGVRRPPESDIVLPGRHGRSAAAGDIRTGVGRICRLVSGHAQRQDAPAPLFDDVTDAHRPRPALSPPRVDLHCNDDP